MTFLLMTQNAPATELHLLANDASSFSKVVLARDLEHSFTTLVLG